MKLLELSRGGEQTVQETKVLFRGESRTAFNAMAAQIGKLVEISNQGSEQAAAAARKSYDWGQGPVPFRPPCNEACGQA